jgi:hypothetical protein
MTRGDLTGGFGGFVTSADDSSANAVIEQTTRPSWLWRIKQSFRVGHRECVSDCDFGDVP